MITITEQEYNKKKVPTGVFSYVYTMDGSGTPTKIGKADLIEALGMVGKKSGSGEIFNSATSAGDNAHAEGNRTNAGGKYSHAEGYSTSSSGGQSHAEGSETIASNWEAHTEGKQTIASGEQSHAEGFESEAKGNFSHASGRHVIATNYSQTAIGSYNRVGSTTSSTVYNSLSEVFTIGNGKSVNDRQNAFKVLLDGSVFPDKSVSAPAADYAEMFEWMDGNPNNEDRVGFFVELVGEKIVKANAKSKMIIGIVSGNPCIIGDNPDRWHKLYETDEWGRRIIEEKELEYVVSKEMADGSIVDTVEKRMSVVQKVNQNYNENEEYIRRTDRKEWDAVGMLGKLLVRQDGTLKVGDMCMPNDNGIATKSTNGYYVMKVISKNQVLVLFK